MSKKKDFEEGKHYYLEDGKVIMTELYHINRGYCCATGKTKCRHCPYDPPHTKGNKKLNKTLE